MLKSLEMFGFKSFADRTRLDFSSGINCVVGPNGSGKSNVVDAMKWILGDQSAKSLRGKEMTDVIFNGSASRKPSAFAEATLTFDNSSGLLPLDMPEVQIGRRIWRNGDAEYLLNREPSRLKDIRDLFLGTGAGTAAYSIIEQGRVDQILQGNPINRRAVFEEAAGISRFKARKVEAQRKLERVAQNLERLTDIVDEVEAQLNSTRSQAAKAAKYHDVSTALKTWWLGLAADDFRHWSQEIASTDIQLAETSARLEQLNEQQNSLSAHEAAFDDGLARIDSRLRDVQRRNSDERGAVAGFEATIDFQTARWAELDGDLLRLQKQQLALFRRVEETRREIVTCQQKLTDCDTESASKLERVTANDRALQAALQERNQRREQIDANRLQHLELTKRVSNATNLVANLRTRIATLESTQQKVRSQLDALDGTIAEHDLDRQRIAVRLDDAVQAQAAAQNGLREAQAHRLSLLGLQEDTKQTLAELRETRSAAQARKSLLEDLELRQEGLGIGVKEILARARTSSESPWTSVVGGVADLLEVDLERAALLEVALGSRSQLIVLREYQPLLDYLNKGASTLSNRVGFVAVPDQSAAEPAMPVYHFGRFVHLQLDPRMLPDLSQESGVVMRADQLIETDRATAGLAAAILADTWIVQSIDTAIRLATDRGRGLRFVTLQGELLESNGTLHVGTVRSERSLFSRKSELRRLKNDLSLLDRDIEQAERTLQTSYQSLTGADGELEAMAAELDYANQRLLDLRGEMHAREQTLERLQHERAQSMQQFISGDTDLQQQQQELALAQAQAVDWEQQLDGLVATAQDAERLLGEAEQRVQQSEFQRSQDQVELVKHEERLQGLRQQVQRLEHESEQRVVQYEEAERRYTAALGKHAQILLQILNSRAQRDERLLVSEQIQFDAVQLEREKLQLRTERSRIVEQETALRKERHELADRHHAGELRVRELKNALQTLEERLEEEYQVKLAEVVESGASAFALFHTERGTRESTSRGKQRTPGATSPEHVTPAEGDLETPTDDTRDEIAAPPATESIEWQYGDVRPEIEARVNRLRKQLKLMGSVNTDSLRDLEMQETRFQQLSSQLQDLVEAKQTLDEIIRKINAESRRMFIETFEEIRGNFQNLFRQVFGGGEGDVVLENPDDVLDCGIDIAARPPGKELRSISLLSGGEKTMTAIALIMAIFKSKPSPFCILDEVDAALDEANVERFTAVIKALQQSTQFIMITHHKRSMTVGDVLHGVTMEESGVSKRMSIRFEDVSDDGHFKAPPQSSAA